MKRILFVDDEPQVLDGLRALLRPQRARWEMVFVGSGERALAELDGSRFDVVVSDMKMPVMDGATMLRRAEQRHPEVVRIVLSGFTEFETALRTVPMAHQFLLKPCDADVLVNVVERACALQTIIYDDVVRKVAEPLAEKLAPPRLYLELTKVLADDDAGVDQIARVVAADPGVAEAVLRLVNSAFIGLGREIASVDQAIAYLGTNMLKNMVLAVQVFTGRPSASESLWIHRAQRHALLVGTIARRISADDKRTSEDAFIAGVLHDIGKLMLSAGNEPAWTAMTTRSRAEGRPLHEIEHEQMGVTHAELGGYLLGRWGLPYPVIEATANHHAPWRAQRRPGLDALTAVYIANVLAHERERASGADDEPFAPLAEDDLKTQRVHEFLPAWREVASQCVGVSRFAQWMEGPDRRAA